MSLTLYDRAPGFILVFDITSAASFEHIKLLVEKIKSVKQVDDVSTVAIVIVGYAIDIIFNSIL